MYSNLDELVTEQRNSETTYIDRVPTIKMLRMINCEDRKVAGAVARVLEPLAKAVDQISERLQNGGRMVYCGAGTSGRLGILDAAECPPTYGVDPDLVIGIIAGGAPAVFRTQEGAEDSETLCVEDLKKVHFNSKDTLVGIAASGRTPYVIGGMKYALSLGALTVSISCNPNSEMSRLAEISIAPVVGPEAVTGSTRMKAGTAQKMILNMLSTGVMIRLGKVYENLMIDLKANNEKLMERARRIVMEATSADYETACSVLAENRYNVRLSILRQLTGVDDRTAEKLIEKNRGNLSAAISAVKR